MVLLRLEGPFGRVRQNIYEFVLLRGAKDLNIFFERHFEFVDLFPAPVDNDCVFALLEVLDLASADCGTRAGEIGHGGFQTQDVEEDLSLDLLPLDHEFIYKILKLLGGPEEKSRSRLPGEFVCEWLNEEFELD